MCTESIQALDSEWRRLVSLYDRARREAKRNKCCARDLQAIDGVYGLQIDLAFARLKEAESLETLQRRFV